MIKTPNTLGIEEMYHDPMKAVYDKLTTNRNYLPDPTNACLALSKEVGTRAGKTKIPGPDPKFSALAAQTASFSSFFKSYFTYLLFKYVFGFHRQVVTVPIYGVQRDMGHAYSSS